MIVTLGLALTASLITAAVAAVPSGTWSGAAGGCGGTYTVRAKR